MDQALVTWPGVERVVSFNGTLQHGRSPSVFRLTIAPQERVVAGTGTLMLTFGSTRIQFPECIVDSASYQFDEGGFLVGLHLIDRRWKWRFPVISGSYNQTDDAGRLIDSGGANAIDSPLINGKRTPQQLARLLFEAMGERGFEVSELPNDVFPRVDWSLTNASLALADLAEQLGCRIVLGLDGKARLKRLGQGKPLPNLPFVDAQLEINPDEAPSSVRVVSAPVLFQVDFELEAVGLETDGTIQPIDKLSYKPSAGWAVCDPHYFAAITTPAHRQLALQSVFRWYRIVVPIEVQPPLNGARIKIQDRRQVILEERQIEGDTEGDQQRRRDAWVFGVWYAGDFSTGVTTLVTSSEGNSAASPTPIASQNDAQHCTVSFHLDHDNRLVRFAEPVYRLVASTHSLSAAKLRLRTAFRLRNYQTGEFHRAAASQAVKGAIAKTAPMTLVRDDIEPTSRQQYTTSYAKNGVLENAADVQKRMKYYLDTAIGELGISDPAAKKYPGLLAIELDGALQSIQWEIGLQGGFTTIQRNQDRAPPGAVPYAIKRHSEKLRFAANLASGALRSVDRATRVL